MERRLGGKTMSYKYQSNYTGKQIDAAIKKLLDGSINLEDFSPELVAEIKKWVGEGSELATELKWGTHLEFPVTGEFNKLYIATDEPNIYYWNGDHFVVIGENIPTIDLIDCGGAKEHGRE